MALFKELLVADLSGKVGANVFSHNAGGKYVRVLAIPTNPNTPQQVTVRNAFALLTTQWFNILTVAQRQAWTVYAANVPVINRVGDSVNLSGLAMYVRNNTARTAVLSDPIFDAPTDFTNSVYLSQLPSNATEAGQTVDVPFGTSPLTNPWANEAGSFLFVYVARPQNVSIRYFKGPYRFAGSQQGDPSPPASPLTVSVPFAIVEGQKLFIRTVITQSDGRISGASLSDTLVVA